MLYFIWLHKEKTLISKILFWSNSDPQVGKKLLNLPSVNRLGSSEKFFLFGI